ncbi:MAG: hypothetical protein WA435_07195 [Gallionellaceae bacterium]
MAEQFHNLKCEVLLGELLQEIRGLRADMAGRAAPPDTGALLAAIYGEIGDTAFNCHDLMERAALVPELGAALNQRIDRVTGRKLGRLFRQIENVVYGGLVARCVGSERDGLIWQVVRV